MIVFKVFNVQQFTHCLTLPLPENFPS